MAYDLRDGRNWKFKRSVFMSCYIIFLFKFDMYIGYVEVDDEDELVKQTSTDIYRPNALQNGI